MASTYSSTLRIELIGTGDQPGTWGNTTNTNLGSIIEQAITGLTSVDVSSGAVTLTVLNGAVDQARSAVLVATGTPSSTATITIPNVNKTYYVNNTTAQSLSVKTAGGSAYTMAASSLVYVYCDGSNNVVGPVTTIAATIPTGSVFHFAATSAPSGYLECNGAAISRVAYAALFTIIGTTFGAGNGSTTFNIPDLRGEFIRGWDDGRGIDPSRAFGSTQADAYKSHNHSASDSGHSHVWYGGTLNSDYVVYDGSQSQIITFALNQGGGAAYTNTGYANITIGASGSTETRPVNVALLPCIKT